jgi:large subunit ribosomal protein L32
MKTPSVSRCPHCNEIKFPHRICPNCGHYGGEEVVPEKSKE